MTTICSSGRTDTLSFVIYEDEEDKYVAEVLEYKNDKKIESFDGFKPARTWVGNLINDHYNRLYNEDERNI